MKQLTVKDLLKHCVAVVKAGNGDKNIVISNDNEGNGYHGLFYGFMSVDDDCVNIYDSKTRSNNDTIILG